MNSPLFLFIAAVLVSSSISTPVDKKVARINFNGLLNQKNFQNLLNNVDKDAINDFLSNPQVQSNLNNLIPNPQVQNNINNIIDSVDKDAINDFLSNPQVQSNLNNLIPNPQVQNNINNIIDIKPLENGAQTLIDAFKASTPVPVLAAQQPVPTTLPDLSVFVDALLSNITEDDREYFKQWLELNLVFLVNTSDSLSDVERGFILNSLPSIMASKTVDEFYQNLNPLLLTGIAAYFQDPTIMFAPNPYAEAANRFLRQYFASQEAPEFLKNDLALQQYIIDYANSVLTTNDLQAAILQISNDLVAYLNSASTQEIRNLIQAYFPELYQVVQNDSELDAILTTTYQYIVTQGVNLYGSILAVFQPALAQAKQIAKVAKMNKELLASFKALGKK